MMSIEEVDHVNIQYLHASKFGNGAAVATVFAEVMGGRGVVVEVHHIADVDPRSLPAADLFVFSSPGRMGRPTRGMRRFLKDLVLPAGSRYAVLTTEMAPRPDGKTARMPTEEEICRHQRIRPIVNEMLRAKGLVKIAEEKVYVTDLKGPLEEGWREKVAAFAATIALSEPDPV